MSATARAVLLMNCVMMTATMPMQSTKIVPEPEPNSGWSISSMNAVMPLLGSDSGPARGSVKARIKMMGQATPSFTMARHGSRAFPLTRMAHSRATSRMHTPVLPIFLKKMVTARSLGRKPGSIMKMMSATRKPRSSFWMPVSVMSDSLMISLMSSDSSLLTSGRNRCLPRAMNRSRQKRHVVREASK